jgi:hypothetical protein
VISEADKPHQRTRLYVQETFTFLPLTAQTAVLLAPVAALEAPSCLAHDHCLLAFDSDREVVPQALAIAGLGDGATEMERRSKHATQFPNVGKEMGPIEFNCCTTRREHHAKHDRNPQPLGSRVDDPSAV